MISRLHAPVHRWRKLWRQGDLWTAIVCLLPAIILFGAFNIFPLLYSGYLSLVKWDGLSPKKTFVGLANYVGLARSADFWNSLGVTLYYMIGVTILGIAASLIVALVLNARMSGLSFYRTIYFTPEITSCVAAAVVWKYLFDPGSGFVNVALRSIHLPAPAWLSSTTWAMPAIILVGIWKGLGFKMVIYLAALQSIPRQYYEAAKTDGANAWARFRYITIPLLVPTTILLIIKSVIDSFLVFDQVFVMTGRTGSPMGATDVVGLLLYRNAFDYWKMGTASAVGWVTFMVIFTITLTQWKLFGFGERQTA